MIRCRLQPSFWRDEPNISDPRLNLWLATKEADDKLHREDPHISLVPLQGESFRLEFANSLRAEEAAFAEAV